MSRAQLVAAKEESTEFGGYFICNGIERIIRMLIMQVRAAATPARAVACVRACVRAWCSTSGTRPSRTPAWVHSKAPAAHRHPDTC
jgi:DNA-directed RNA polymerase beta subunit